MQFSSIQILEIEAKLGIFFLKIKRFIIPLVLLRSYTYPFGRLTKFSANTIKAFRISYVDDAKDVMILSGNQNLAYEMYCRNIMSSTDSK